MAFLSTTDQITTSENGFSLLRLISKPFDWLVALAERSPRATALDRLAELSDDDLAALGTTRIDEVQRILGSQVFL